MTEDTSAPVETWTVGELAEMFELTVRTLHHWETIGLLTPERSETGHRRYGPVEADRVMRICVLRGLGMSLDDVRVALDEPNGLDARAFLEREVERLGAQLRELEQQRSGLRSLLAILGSDSDARAVAAALTRLGAGLAALSPEQMERLETINAELDDDQLQLQEQRGLAIHEELLGLQRSGAAPDDPAALDAARRSRELLLEMVRDDRDLAMTLEHMSMQPGFGSGFVGEMTESEREWYVDVLAHLPW